MAIYAVQCGAVQCSSADWNDRDEKERRGDERRGQGRGGKLMIASSLSLALHIIWLHAIAWGLEWIEIGWNRVEVSTGE
jgi:hypothetical protein